MEFKYVAIFLGVALALALIGTFVTSYICFCKIFLSRRTKGAAKDDSVTAIVGEGFKPFYGMIGEWNRQVASMSCRDVSITSFDGLTLRGKFYEYEKGAPIELLMHGYKGSMERDMCGGVVRCFKQGRSALCIDHRASGSSDGRVITFGVNESRDCEAWVDFIINEIDKDAKIILTGISMGAATVLITAGRRLPDNVVAVLADCGYTSAREIIFKVVREMKLPARLLYPFIKLGAFLFGRFNIDANSPIEAVKRAKTPIIFIHGDSDGFVPHEMSVKLSEVCASRCKMVTIPGAEHGLAYPIDKELYVKALKDFYRISR